MRRRGLAWLGRAGPSARRWVVAVAISGGACGLDPVEEAPDCSHVEARDPGELFFVPTSDEVDVVLIGPLAEVDEYPSGTYATLGRLADGLARRDAGLYRIEFAEFGEIEPDGTERDGWFIRYEYFVDARGEIWRLVKEGVLPPNRGYATGASAVERIDPDEVEMLAATCTSVYAHRRARCVHDILAAAPSVAVCGEPDAGVE